ncbi:TetR/AcrR family transcriptional regulator [Alkalihalobacterium chitinilyticum]|uniref:TetR/AcrR family transcriptional regulator n=1 Tax=Alkalihalobacterium chitinilyticum TaxID=2980103 RepID=A0ABT5VFS0_9BACI|nr:TetR/AcrR family transcriptional regulator [Alkalihalobacterium chitinilyticum]MDE5414291.1 TetR/AcrR family transcriptional regulator [Alkalihalobacterium chitinilyticum]
MTDKKMTERAKQAQQRRNELLQSAKRLFAEKGYHATTTRSINQSIGMADGLIYHYFPEGKKQILFTLIEEESERKLNGMRQAVSSLHKEMPVDEFLFNIAKIIFKYATKDKEYILILFRESNILESDAITSFFHQFKETIDFAVDILNHYIAENKVKDLDPRMMLMQFSNSITIYIIQKLIMNKDFIFGLEEEEDYIRMLVDHTVKTWSRS